MKKYKICVYAICCNEEKFIDRWMSSMSEADAVIVMDTGSTDESVKLLRSKGAMVFEEKISPWRFDTARNLSLSHVPKWADICVCTDIDEVFEKGWRKKLEKAWHKGVKRATYTYNWSFKEDGSPDKQFTYFKIHSRFGFEWVYPVHEILKYSGSDKYKEIFVNGLVLNHYPDPSKSRGSYIALLEMAVNEMPGDSRMNFYLGREYYLHGMWQQCIDRLTVYLSLSSWREERADAMTLIANCFKNLGNITEAYKWHNSAISQCPHMREPYAAFANTAYGQKDWQTLQGMVEKALDIKEKSFVYINTAGAWDHTLYDLGTISSYNLGYHAQALEYARKALELKPDDARLKGNYELINHQLTSHLQE